MKKKNRIKKSEEFQSLIYGKKKRANQSFVLYFDQKKTDQARIGISLSKKMGHAVLRNKIKRQTRMMCEELINFRELPIDGVLIVRFGYLQFDYNENKKSLEKLLRNATIR